MCLTKTTAHNLSQHKTSLHIYDILCYWLWPCPVKRVFSEISVYIHFGWVSYIATTPYTCCTHDDVIKWNHFTRYLTFVRGIHRSLVNSPLKGQWRGALKFSLICAWINGLVNSPETGDLRCHRAHYDVIVMHIEVTHYPHIETVRTNQFADITLVHALLLCPSNISWQASMASRFWYPCSRSWK